MTPELKIRAAKLLGYDQFFGLKKRGLWYRSNANGYTHREDEAGRYTMEDAKKHEYLIGHPDEHVTIHKLSPPALDTDRNHWPKLWAKMTAEQRAKLARNFAGPVQLLETVATQYPRLVEIWCDVMEGK